MKVNQHPHHKCVSKTQEEIEAEMIHNKKIDFIAECNAIEGRILTFIAVILSVAMLAKAFLV